MGGFAAITSATNRLLNIMKLEMISTIVTASTVAALVTFQKLPVIPSLPPLPTQPAQHTENFLTLQRTIETLPGTKDPVWVLDFVDKSGKIVRTMRVISGRAYRQTENRHTAGNKSPLPVGTYSIDSAGIAHAPFSDPELGKGYWVPISPLFTTGRSALGFHQDPSWGKPNGESGTSGCIGLESPEETAILVDWILNNKVKKLKVLN